MATPFNASDYLVDRHVREGDGERHAVPSGDGSEIELTLEYQLAKYGPLAGVADAIFIRRALRDALRRTLVRFAIEAEDEAGLR